MQSDSVSSADERFARFRDDTVGNRFRHDGRAKPAADGACQRSHDLHFGHDFEIDAAAREGGIDGPAHEIVSRRQQHRHPIKCADRYGLQVWIDREIAMSNEVEFLPQDRLEPHALDRPRAVDQRHFQSAGHDHLAIGLTNALRQMKQNARMSLACFGQEIDRKCGGAAEGHEADRDASGKRIAGGCRIRLRLFHLAQDDLRMPIDGVSCVGHADALLASDQELLAEMFLECGQLLAQSRLGEMQDIGGSRNAAAVDDGNEGFEASDIHGIDYCSVLARHVCRRASVLQRAPMWERHADRCKSGAMPLGRGRFACSRPISIKLAYYSKSNRS